MTRYGVRDGLQDRRVRDVLEAGSGDYSVSMTAGLCRLDSHGERRFVAQSLGDELRRQVYLVFKEAVSNAARHSNCSEADVRLEIEHDRLRLSVVGDGDGFDPSVESDGNGLTNKRRRATAVGGALDVRSEPGRGTTVVLAVRLGPALPPKRGG